MGIMKKIFLTFGFAGILVIQSLSQSKVESDPQYSVYNYKHPNKAAYAKKRNLDKRILQVKLTSCKATITNKVIARLLPGNLG